MSELQAKWFEGFVAEYSRLRIFVEQGPERVEIALYDKPLKKFIWSGQADDFDTAKETALAGARQYLSNPSDPPSGWKPY